MEYDLEPAARQSLRRAITFDARSGEHAAPIGLADPASVLRLQSLAGNRATVTSLRGMTSTSHADSDGRGDGGAPSSKDTAEPASKGPVPVAVRNGPRHGAIDDADAVGLSIAITLTSSSGRDEDMAHVHDSEQVSTSFNHKGSYASIDPFASRNTEYMPGYPIPDDRHAEEVDRIFSLADHHGGSGSYEREQLDTFKAPALGITEPQAIPNSGYAIKRTIVASGGKIRFRVEKWPQSCTVKGFSSDAGPSPKQSAIVVVRP